MESTDIPQPPYEAALRSFADFTEENNQVLLLCMRSISNMQGLEKLTRVLNRDDESIEAAQQLEALAKREREGGFQLLIRHAVVAIWSALDASVPRFVAAYIQAFPDLLKGEAFTKVRLPAAALLASSETDVCGEIVLELERNSNATLKRGVGRFECLLDAVGLSRVIDDQQRRDLLELSQVRNLIVHKFGVVDARFATACPWLGLAIGDKLILSFDHYRRYHAAACLYVADIVKTSRLIRGATRHREL